MKSDDDNEFHNFVVETSVFWDHVGVQIFSFGEQFYKWKLPLKWTAREYY